MLAWPSAEGADRIFHVLEINKTRHLRYLRAGRNVLLTPSAHHDYFVSPYAFASDVAGRQWEPQQPLHEFFIIFVFSCFIIYACKYFIASVIIVFHVKHRYDHDSAEKS